MAMTDQRDEEGPPTQLQLAKEHKLRAAKLLSPRKLSFKRARVREAAEEYLKAAEILYQEGQLLDAWLCLQDSFECYNRKQMWFEGARALEQKVVVDYLIRQKGQSQSGGDSGDSEAKLDMGMARKVTSLHLNASQPDNAIRFLERTAEMVGASDPESSIQLLTKAAQIAHTVGRPFQAACYLSSVFWRELGRSRDAGNLAKLSQVAQQLVDLHMESGNNQGVETFSMIMTVVLVALGDIQKALMGANKYGSLCSDRINEAMDSLLNAARAEGDDDTGGSSGHQGVDEALRALKASSPAKEGQEELGTVIDHVLRLRDRDGSKAPGEGPDEMEVQPDGDGGAAAADSEAVEVRNPGAKVGNGGRGTKFERYNSFDSYMIPWATTSTSGAAASAAGTTSQYYHRRPTVRRVLSLVEERPVRTGRNLLAGAAVASAVMAAIENHKANEANRLDCDLVLEGLESEETD